MFRPLRSFFAGALLVCSFVLLLPLSSIHAEATSAELNTQFKKINAPKGTPTQGIIFAGICDAYGTAPADTSSPDNCPCRATGNCTLSDVLQLFVNLSTFILGISGSAVLFVFVYGGFKWIFSRGDTKWVEAGRGAITAGIIGLCIIFGAYVAINFIVAGLVTDSRLVPPTTKLEETINKGIGTKASDVFTTE